MIYSQCLPYLSNHTIYTALYITKITETAKILIPKLKADFKSKATLFTETPMKAKTEMALGPNLI